MAEATIGRTGLVGEGGLEERIGVERVGEGAYEGLHGRMPGTIEAERDHFGYGLVGRPMIEGDAVGSDEHSGTVLAKLTVNENFLRRRTLQKLEKFGELCGSGIGETANGKRNEMNAQRFSLLLLAIAKMARLGAQINDDGDADFFQFSKIGNTRLGAAK